MAEAKNVVLTELVFLDRGATAEINKAKGKVIDFGEAARKAGKKAQQEFDRTARSTKNLTKASQSLKANMTKTSQSLKANMGQVRTAALGAAAAFVAIGATLTKLTKAAAQHEVAQNRLLVNLGLQSEAAQSFAKTLEAQASSLQMTTRFSDTAVIGVQALLASFGLLPSEIERVTQASADLAAAMGFEIEEAALNLGRAYSGLAGRLSQMIPVLAGVSSEQLKAGRATDIVLATFGGAAGKEVKTFSGAMAQVSNALGDVIKHTGFFITKSKPFLSAIDSLTRGFNGLAQTILDIGKATSSADFLERARDNIRSLEEDLDALRERQQGGIIARVKFGAPLAEDEFASQELSLRKEIARLETFIKEETAVRTEIAKELGEAKKREADALTRAKQIQKDQVKAEKSLLEIRKELVAATETPQEAAIRAFDEQEANLVKLHKLLVEQDNLTLDMRRKHEQEIAELRELNAVRFGKQMAEIIEGEKSELEKDIQLSWVKGLKESFKDLFENLPGQPQAPAIPGLSGIVGAFAGPIGAISSITSSIANIGGILKGMLDSVKGFFKSVGGFFKGLFGGGRGFEQSFGEAITRLIDESRLAEAMDKLTDSLDRLGNQFRTAAQVQEIARVNVDEARGRRDDAVKGFLDQFDVILKTTQAEGVEGIREFLTPFARLTPEQRARAEFRDISTRPDGAPRPPERHAIGSRGGLRTFLEAGVDVEGGQFRAKDQKKLEEAIESLSTALEEEAQTIVELTNLRIQAVQKELDAVNRMVDMRNSLVESFDKSIDAIRLGNAPIAETVEELRATFRAAQGEEIGDAAEALRGALVSRFEQAKGLAAQGVITGEELARIQQEVLGDLEAAQTQSVDKLQVFVDEQKRLNDQIQTLKDTALEQLDTLKEIVAAVKEGNAALFSRLVGEFQSGTSFVPRTGLALVHQGEQIIPKNEVMPSITVNVNGGSGGAKEIAEAVSQAIRLNLGGIRTQISRVA